MSHATIDNTSPNATILHSSVARHLKVGVQSKIEANVPTKYS